MRSRRSLKVSHTRTSVPCGTLNKYVHEIAYYGSFLQTNEPVTSRLVFSTKVIEWKVMATVVKSLKKLTENGWIKHVTLSRRFLFLQKLKFHINVCLLTIVLKMLPMTFKKKATHSSYVAITPSVIQLISLKAIPRELLT